jgi:exodeoxyribonuclease VII small subunit
MKPKKESFEVALKELERIIARLESEELSLEEMLAHFETGVNLIRTCDTHLSSAEGKLKELLAGENGELVEKVLGPTLASFLAGEKDDE